MIQITLAGLIVALTTIALIKRIDPRLVLIASGLLLCAVAGEAMQGLDAFALGMTRSGPLQSICAALGFAAVVRLANADETLVTLVAEHVRHIPLLLVMSATALTFILNISIPSGSGVAAVVGTTMIPLMIRCGISPITAAGAVLSGTFGSMLSPGFAQGAVLAQLTGEPAADLITRAAAPTVAALLLVCLWNILADSVRPRKEAAASPEVPVSRRSLPLAAGALIPIFVYLFGAFLNASFGVVDAVLIGTAYLLLLSPERPALLLTEFFNGMGKAFADVFGITIAATVFAAGFQAAGLLDMIVASAGNGDYAKWLFGIVPFLIALITGSSDAVTLAINQNFVPHAADFGMSAVDFGLMVAQAAQHGRVISPFAGATLIVCALADIRASELLTRLLPPFALATILIIAFYP